MVNTYKGSSLVPLYPNKEGGRALMSYLIGIDILLVLILGIIYISKRRK